MKECCEKSLNITQLPFHGVEGKTVPVSFSFCIECGTRLRPIKDCCNNSAKYGFKFCQQCGENLMEFIKPEPIECGLILHHNPGYLRRSGEKPEEAQNAV